MRMPGNLVGGISVPEPTGYEFFEAFTSDSVWVVPESRWYRIFCFGKCGNGGNGSKYVGSNQYGAGGAGGNSGGAAVSELYLKKGESINITANVIASFGDLLSATSGSNGGSASGMTGGSVISGVGQGAGGNIINTYGYLGGKGGNGAGGTGGAANGGNGGNAGGLGGTRGQPSLSNSGSGGGGGGARYDATEPLNKYVAEVQSAGFIGGGDGGYYYEGLAGKSYYAWIAPIIAITGAGGGGGGCGASSYNAGSGGTGHPATVIIERGVR